MIKKVYGTMDVVTAAKQRIKNVFSNGRPVILSLSGGKDSAVLSDLVFNLCVRGEVDKNLLTVVFIDEEAIYPCVERVVMNQRMKYLSIGVKFEWYCIECKHFNCFNMLQNDESFICWDRYKKDVWVRQPPKFAIMHDPAMLDRQINYQTFMRRKFAGWSANLVGLRASESIHRLQAIGQKKGNDGYFAYPCYDWTDSDVWLYIREHNVEIPDAYQYMYQVGLGKNKMRISQFFSIDTAGSIVRMCEFYPNLFERICKREPNAYMATLYWDTEMYRSAQKSKRAEDNKDYKEETYKLLNNDAYFISDNQKELQAMTKRMLMRYSYAIQDEGQWRRIYGMLVAGDPKRRTYRAMMNDIRARDVKRSGGKCTADMVKAGEWDYKGR